MNSLERLGVEDPVTIHAVLLQYLEIDVSETYLQNHTVNTGPEKI